MGSLSEMTVTGLANGAQLQVASGEDQILASSLADGIGTAMLATAHTTAMRGVYAAIDVAGRAGDAPERERSVTISQELLERRGTLRLAQSPTAVFAPSTFGGGRFLAVFEDGAVLIDATTPTRPRASTTWDIPQVHGVIADARRTLVFGRAGLFAIDRRGDTVPPRRRTGPRRGRTAGRHRVAEAQQTTVEGSCRFHSGPGTHRRGRDDRRCDWRPADAALTRPYGDDRHRGLSSAPACWHRAGARHGAADVVESSMAGTTLRGSRDSISH